MSERCETYWDSGVRNAKRILVPGPYGAITGCAVLAALPRDSDYPTSGADRSLPDYDGALQVKGLVFPYYSGVFQRPNGEQLNKLFPAAAAAAILALTGCGGGSDAASSETAAVSATDTACNLLFEKGASGRLVRAASFLANLPAELDASHVTLAEINAGDLEYVAGKADDEMKPLLQGLVATLGTVASGPKNVDTGSFTFAEGKVVEMCSTQAADYTKDRTAAAASVKKIADETAAKEKKAADDAAKKAADEAAAKAAAEAAKAPKEYAGAGADVVTISKRGTGPQVAVITHVGWSNFAVHTLDSTMDSTDLLVNTIGNYSGTVLFDASSRGGESTALKITADGPWTVKLLPLTSVRSFDGSAPMTGRGDEVFAYTGAAKAAAFTHDGSSNIAVKFYGTRNDLLINEIGPYSGTVVWARGFYQVTADGNWSATLK